MNIYDMSVADIAEAVEAKVNVMGNSGMMKELVGKLSVMHRTLIQSFFGKFILPYVKKMAMDYKNGWYDARNQTACEMASAMWDGLKGKYEWVRDDVDCELPLI